MKTFKKQTAAPSHAAISRSELERLEAQRRKPVAARALTRHGMRQIANTQDHTKEEMVCHIRRPGWAIPKTVQRG